MDAGYGSVGPDGYEPAATSSQSDLVVADLKEKKKIKYPYSVFFILSNEFCERFSYYGMRAILVLYLTRWLSYGESTATSVFHGFSMMCYVMPLFGAVIADGYLGRYKTILSVSCVYFVGNLILSLTAIPPPESYGPAIGLFLIAIGTGGIKASVAPFGADQFEAGQEKSQNSFFSAFYFMINLGSMLSMLFTPILRADVQCFGGDCYVLAFGVPAILMLLSVILFFCGRNLYKKVPPTGNVIGKTIKCIYFGAVGKMCRQKFDGPRDHWLYYADDRFDNKFIEDVRRLMKVLLMFLPLPVFWALSNQQGSRWTLQAEHMHGNMGIFGILKPDQMQALNPILILALIPLFEKVIYPLLDKCRIPNRPLQRMVVGLYISSVAFVCAGLVQIRIDDAEDPSVRAGETGVTFLNTVPCTINIQSQLYNGNIQSNDMTDFMLKTPNTYNVSAEAICSFGSHRTRLINKTFIFEEKSAYRIIVYETDTHKLRMAQFIDQREKPRHGDAALSIFAYTDPEVSLVTLVSEHYISKDNSELIGTSFNIMRNNATEFKDIEPNEYTIFIPDIVGDSFRNMGVKLQLGTGGVYTAFIRGDAKKIDLIQFTDMSENTVSMLWLVPQYVLITVGEVLFSISGLSFAYSQAPESLKSVVQAVWLATTGFGDLVVIIVANIHAIPSQMAEFFLFACLMFIDTIIFMIMAMFYHYKPNSLYSELHDDADTLKSDYTDPSGAGNEVTDTPSKAELVPLHIRKMTVTAVE